MYYMYMNTSYFVWSIVIKMTVYGLAQMYSGCYLHDYAQGVK